MEVFRHERAKQLIVEKGYRRRWVATQIGLVHGSLNQYLIGARRPGRETVARLAELLGVDVSELFAESGHNKVRTA